MKYSVLIVEDENAIATMLKYNLEKEGYDVYWESRGDKVIDSIDKNQPDVILLDWMLPELSGVEICRLIRNNPEYRNIPVMLLTARGEEEDKIKGLNSGADDYITKPFSVPELMARIKAHLRRIPKAIKQKEITFEDITIDMVTKRVMRNDEHVHMGPTEFRLLQYLMEHPFVVFSRDELLKAVWGESIYVEARTVDVHIRRLRKALNEKGADYIRTVRAAGYSLDTTNKPE